MIVRANDHGLIPSCMDPISWRVATTPEGWVFRSRSRDDIRVAVGVKDRWLCLESSLNSQPSEWDLLNRCSRLPGGWKPVCESSSTEVSLRVEIAWDEDVEAVPIGIARLRNALNHLEGVLGLIGSDPTEGDGGVPASAGKEIHNKESGDWTALLAEAGWGFTERSASTMAVELGSGPNVSHAEVGPQSDGSLGAVVRLAPLDGYAPPARDAVARLLLTVSGMVRLVCPAIVSTDAGWEARLEVDLGHAPQATDFDDALSALSVASALSSSEVRFLRDERAAFDYLAWPVHCIEDILVHN